MSIKAVHLVVIATSILLALGCGGWALDSYAQNRDWGALTGGLLATIAGLLLLWYLKLVTGKFRQITRYENL
jgi:hypothetical protein